MSYPESASNRIQWFEGMLLMPQHFQQADQRIDHLFHIHLTNSVSHYWGVLDYQIDEAALLAGRVSFLTLEAILPDGTFFALLPEERDRFTIDLSSYPFTPPVNTLTVYLAIPAYITGSTTVGEELSRYISIESRAVCDENTGEGAENLPLLRPNVLLVAGEEPSARYSSFPILQVKKGDSAFSLCDNFVPPHLKVKPEQPLGQMGLALTKKIREKIFFLGDRLHHRTDALISADAENAVKGLRSDLLPFEAVVQAGCAHPFTVYLSLCSLAGSISTLQPEQMPPSFLPYNHNALFPTFNQVFEYINAILAHIQEGYYVVVFEREDRTFRLALRQSWKRDKLILGAKAPKGMSLIEMAKWIQEAVIATDSHVAAVRDKRILGAKRTLIESENTMQLFPAKDSLLFAVDYQSEFLNFDETLNIFNIADHPQARPLEIVMYVPKKG
jgi:type VI secretion system protein ImpJ